MSTSTIESAVDEKALTLSFVANFDAPPERVWQVWEDPRQLERWWGPPTYPATFTQHELVAGATSKYHMTGPEGDQPRGWWTISRVDSPHRLEFDDGFSDDAGNPQLEMGVAHAVVTLEGEGAGTKMTIVTHFGSAEVMENMLNMGMREGMGLALTQIEGILAGK